MTLNHSLLAMVIWQGGKLIGKGGAKFKEIEVHCMRVGLVARDGPFATAPLACNYARIPHLYRRERLAAASSRYSETGRHQVLVPLSGSSASSARTHRSAPKPP